MGLNGQVGEGGTRYPFDLSNAGELIAYCGEGLPPADLLQLCMSTTVTYRSLDVSALALNFEALSDGGVVLG